MNNQAIIDQAVTVVKQGGVIAYPTEAVYGLGCDPFNEQAVTRLLQIKQRPVCKGLILIAASWEQVSFLTVPLPKELFAQIQASWPGPATWVFPASPKAPAWICGEHASIALRVTAHPIAQQLCQAYGKALVSTSANPSTQKPAGDAQTVENYFTSAIDFIVPGEVGGLAKPTQIRDALSGKLLR